MKSLNRSLTLFCVIALAALSGCGGGRNPTSAEVAQSPEESLQPAQPGAPSGQIPKPVNLTAESIASEIQFWLYPSDPRNPGLVDPAAIKGSQSEPLRKYVQASVIEFAPETSLFDRAFKPELKLYLAFPAAIKGSKIQHASMRRFMLNDNDERISDPASDRISIDYDRDSNLWIIPVSRLFAQAPANVDPKDRYGIWLQLSFEGIAGVQQIELLYRGAGEIPPARRAENSRELTSSIENYTAQYQEFNGYRWLSETITNASDRQLRLWLKLTNDPSVPAGHLQYFAEEQKCFYASLSHLHLPGPFISCPSGQFPGPHNSVFISDVDLSLGRVRILREDGTKTDHHLENGQIVSITIDPREKIALDWVMEPIVLNPGCVLPGPASGGDGVIFKEADAKFNVKRSVWISSLVATESMVQDPATRADLGNRAIQTIAIDETKAAEKTGARFIDAFRKVIRFCSYTRL